MFRSNTLVRQKVYHPNMDGRNFGEQICVSGNNFMTSAEKKQLIKYQLKFFKKETSQYSEYVSPSIQFQGCAKIDLSLPLHYSYSQDSRGSSEQDFSNNIYISTVSGMQKMSTASFPKILINVNEYSVYTIYNESKNQVLLGSKVEFKNLLYLIEQLYYLYFQIQCLKHSESSAQKQAITLKLQVLLGFNQNVNNILPLKLMCVRKGCSLINCIFDILDLSNQEHILTLFIDYLPNFLTIYCQVDPNQDLYSHLLSILPLLSFDILCDFARKLIQNLDTCKEYCFSCSKIPTKLLLNIHSLLEAFCKEALSEYQVLLYTEITLSQALYNQCNI